MNVCSRAIGLLRPCILSISLAGVGLAEQKTNLVSFEKKKLLKTVIEVKAFDGTVADLKKKIEEFLWRPKSRITLNIPKKYLDKRLKLDLRMATAMTLARLIGEHIGAEVHGDYPFKIGKGEITYTFLDS